MNDTTTAQTASEGTSVRAEAARRVAEIFIEDGRRLGMDGPAIARYLQAPADILGDAESRRIIADMVAEAVAEMAGEVVPAPH